MTRTTLGHGGLAHHDIGQTDRYLGREARVRDDETAAIGEIVLLGGQEGDLVEVGAFRDQTCDLGCKAWPP